MHNSNKTKTISWRNCGNYEEHLYLMPVEISNYSLYTLNKYRRVLDVKWERYRYNISSGMYERTPYSYVNYREFYPKSIYDTLEYFSTLIVPQRKTNDYLKAILFELEENWYKSLYSQKTSYGILKLMMKLNMIYKVCNHKRYHKYYLNPVIYHDLSIKQMELYCNESAYLFKYARNELPSNKESCKYFTVSKESINSNQQRYG